MSKESPSTNTEPYDVIVVGAGICGVIFLKYARDQGLRCLALEKQDDVGGLWNWLPAWQDIQNRKEDFAINDVPLDGVKQPHIRQHVREWVQAYDLAPSIRLNHEVTSVSWTGDEWHVQTSQGTFLASYLIVASGVQNEPWTPEVERSPDIAESHSSALHRPEDLAGRRVTVVGGGTSAWDLLDQAIKHGASDIHWVHRSTKWCMPTGRSKQTARPNLRELAIIQTVAPSTEAVNTYLRGALKKRYDYFQLAPLEPAERFDIRKHQLIPSRSLMTRNLDAITRHRSEVRHMRGHEVTLENEERFETDVVLWGTGYRMNLAYLGLPEYSSIGTLDELRPRLGSLVRSTDYPRLFFLGMSLIDSTSSTPFFAAIEAKSIVAHIRGLCTIPKRNVPHPIVHWDLFEYFARFDHATYPVFWWRLKYALLAGWYGLFQNRSVSL